MPVNDAMFTHNEAERLKKITKNKTLRKHLNRVQNNSVDISAASAKNVMDFFTVLEKAMASDDPEVAALATKIYYGPYNTEIA